VKNYSNICLNLELIAILFRPLSTTLGLRIEPGLGHADGVEGMLEKRLILVALCVAFGIYSALVYTRGTDTAGAVAMNDQARYGQRVFQEYNCIACHQIYGLGGYMGPDLTNVMSNRGEAYADAFITAGTASMPDFDLDEHQINALLAYLKFVDATGTYPAENFDIQWYGTVAQEDDPQ